MGRYDDALRHLGELRDLAERFNNAQLSAASRVQLGILAVMRGRREEARGLLEEALNLSLAVHSTRNVTLCLTGFAQLAFEEGNPERAALLVGAAEGLRRRAGLRAWPTVRQGGAEPVAQIGVPPLRPRPTRATRGALFQGRSDGSILFPKVAEQHRGGAA